MARQMKDSGVAWIGMMPDGWRIKKGKHVLVYLERSIKDTDSVVTCFRDGQVTLRSNRRELGFTVSLQEIGYKGVEPGDLVVHGMDGFAGSIGISDSRGKCSPVLNILDSEEDKNFLMYYLRMMAYGNVFLALSTGIRERTCDTNWNKLKELPYPVPGRDVQNMIASILTFKCAEIDKVVAQTRATIEEYKKLKQAIITEAVTKGVRGPRPMKPSGVEWIGDIPEEWCMKRFKYLGTYRNGLTYKPEELSDSGILVLRSSNIQNGQIALEDNVYVDSVIKDELKVRKGDILICSRNGSRELIGKSAIIKDDMDASFGAFMMIFRSNSPEYMRYILNSSVFSYYLASFFTATINQLTANNFGNMKVPFCSNLEEQKGIIDFLDTKCAEIDRIIQKKEQLIEELGSYKKSLIYEYVTGKKEVTA